MKSSQEIKSDSFIQILEIIYAIIFACANPVPEISPESAKNAGAKIIATGRSDYPNQINNVLGFPGIFKGAFAARAKKITEEMKLAASKALSRVIPDEELSEETGQWWNTV